MSESNSFSKLAAGKIGSTSEKNLRESEARTGTRVEVEKKSLGQRAKDIITSPKTTAVLAGTLGTLVGGGAIVAKIAAGKAAQVAAKKVAQVGFSKGVPATAKLAAKRGLSIVDKIGQIGKSGKAVDLTKTFVDVSKIAKTNKLSIRQAAALSKQIGVRRVNQVADLAVGSRFAVNPKSVGLSTKLLVVAGMSLGTASLAKDIIGTYPYANFIKEESIQTVNFVISKAIASGDTEGAQELIDQVNEIIATDFTWIPYLNVQQALKQFDESAALATEKWQGILDKELEEIEAGETAFQAERKESDEAAFERKRAFGEEETARFEGIRKEGEEREAKENAEFDARRKERELRQQEERELNARYFDAIRAKDFTLANEILKELRDLAERR